MLLINRKQKDLENSSCIFSLQNKSEMIICRQPITVPFNWFFIENKRMNYNNGTVDAAISLEGYTNISLVFNLKLLNNTCQLLKQGTNNLNGLIDISIINNELYGKLYYNFRNKNSIKLEKFNFKLLNNLQNDYHTLIITIDSSNFNINIFEDNIFLDNHIINFSNAFENKFNNTINNTHLIIGDKNVDINYFGIFSNIITPLSFN